MHKTRTKNSNITQVHQLQTSSEGKIKIDLQVKKFCCDESNLTVKYCDHVSLGAGGKKSKRAVAAEEKGRKSCSFAAEEKGRKNCSVAAEKKGRKSCSVAALKGCLLTTWLYSFCLQREEVKQPYSLPLMV